MRLMALLPRACASLSPSSPQAAAGAPDDRKRRKGAIEEESYDTSEEGRDDVRGEGTPREDKLKGKLKH